MAGAGPLSTLEMSSGGSLGLAVVGVEGNEDSEGVPFGTVMNFEPSLLVYLDVFRGDTGVWAAGLWLLAGIVGYGSRAVEGIKMLCATRGCRREDAVERGGFCNTRVRVSFKAAGAARLERVKSWWLGGCGNERCGWRVWGRLKMRHSQSEQQPRSGLD